MTRRSLARGRPRDYADSMPELPEVEITARRLDDGAGGRRGRVGAGARDGRAEERHAAARGDRRARGQPASAGSGRCRSIELGAEDERLALLDPPDVGGTAAALRQARVDEGSPLAHPDPDRRRPRAAAARVRDQAARLGQADGRRRRRRRRDGRDARPRGVAGAAASRSSPSCSTSRGTCIRCSATSARSPGSAAPGSTRSSGRRASPRSRRARSSTATRSSGCTTRSPSSAARSTTTRRSSARRSPTRCRCRCRSTGARASPARAAARRSPRSTTPSGSPVTARRSRPAAGCWRTGGSRGCSSSRSSRQWRVVEAAAQLVDRVVDRDRAGLAQLALREAAAEHRDRRRSRRARPRSRPRSVSPTITARPPPAFSSATSIRSGSGLLASTSSEVVQSSTSSRISSRSMKRSTSSASPELASDDRAARGP